MSLLGAMSWDSWAQDENTSVGFEPNHVFESGAFGENIDVLNGGLSLSIPIGQRYQVSKRLSYQLNLGYTSKLWDHTPPPHLRDQLYRQNAMGLGFFLHFGRIYRDVEYVSPGVNSCTWYYVSPDGNEHEIPFEAGQERCDDVPLGGVLHDSSYYVVGLREQVLAWDGEPHNQPGETDPLDVPKLYVTSADGRIQYEFGHIVQVYGRFETTSQTYMPLNSHLPTPINGETATSTNYNRDFGGWYVTKIVDLTSNGASWINIEYDTSINSWWKSHVIKRITDSVGREIIFTNECVSYSGLSPCDAAAVGKNLLQRPSVRTTRITVPSFPENPAVPGATATANYDFEYEDHSVNAVDPPDPPVPPDPPNPSCPSPNNCPWLTTIILKRIVYPEFTPHAGAAQRYEIGFGYDEAPPPNGPFLLSSGELASRTLPTGATVHYQYGAYYYNYGNTRHLIMKYIPEGSEYRTWLYQREGTDLGNTRSNPTMVTVTDPLANDTVYHFRASLPPQPSNELLITIDNADDGVSPEWDDGINTQIDYYQGTGGIRRLLRTELRDYDADRNGALRTARHVRMWRSRTKYVDDGGKQSVTEYRDWNYQGLWREVLEGGDDVGATRLTRTDYPDYSGDPDYYRYREVSTDQRVLSRVEHGYDYQFNLTLKLERFNLPTQPHQAQNLDAWFGDVVTTLAYDSTGNPLTKEIATYPSAPDARIRYTWQAGGYMLTKEFYDWSAQAYYPWKAIDRSRDAHTGLIYTTRDTSGVETKYLYDPLGRVTEIQPAAPEKPTLVHYETILSTAVKQGDGAGFDCDASVDSGSVLTCYSYDDLGRLIKTRKGASDPAKAVWQETEYDKGGNVIFKAEPHFPSVSPPAGTTFDYADPTSQWMGDAPPIDPFGRVHRVETAEEEVVETAYVGLTSYVTVHDVAGYFGPPDPGSQVGLSLSNATTRYGRDVWGRLVEVTPPTGAIARYEYEVDDNLKRVTLTDPATLAVQERYFEYDPLGRVRVAVHPESGSSVVTDYDSLGRVRRSVNSRGNVIETGYDGAGRILSTGRPVASTPFPVVAVHSMYTYDEAPGAGNKSHGKLTKVESWDEGVSGTVDVRTLSYGGLNGRLSSDTHAINGWPTEAGSTVLYHYNDLGLQDRIDYPAGPPGKGGAFAVCYTFSNGQAIQIVDATGTSPASACAPAPSSTLATVEYNAAGAVSTLLDQGGGQTTVVFDSMNRPTSITGGVQEDGDWSFESGTYQYDGAGNIHRIGTAKYGYDLSNRLTVFADLDDEGLERRQFYGYDGFGNQVTQRWMTDVSITHDSLQTVTYNPAAPNRNRILSHQVGTTLNTFAYDEQGNLLADDDTYYEYNVQNHLIATRAKASAQTSDKARYAYAADGGRVWREDPKRSLVHYYVRDAGGRLLSEFRRTRTATHSPEWAKHHVYLGDRLVALRENRVPTPPGGISISSWVEGTLGFVGLSWSPYPAEEGVSIASYRIYRSPYSGTPAWTLRDDVTGTSFEETVTKGTWYRYVVTSVDSNGRESYPSDQFITKAVQFGLPTPATPTGLAATPYDQRVALKWTKNTSSSDTLVGYHVYRAVGTGGATRLTAVPSPQNSYFDVASLQNGVQYRYTVTAVNTHAVESSFSVEATAIPDDDAPPAPPLELRATPSCGSTPGVTIDWIMADPEAGTTFAVHRYPPFPTGDSIDNGTATSYVDSAVDPDSEYYYWVVASDASDNSSVESLQVAARTRATEGVLLPPQAPFASSGDGRVTLRMPMLAAGETASYRKVFRKRNVDQGCESWEYLGSTALGGAFEDGMATNTVAYDYALSNVNAQGTESAMSVRAVGIPVGAPWGHNECAESLGSAASAATIDGASLCEGASAEYRRLMVRWNSPDGATYQPMWATNAWGTVGYLKGYRLYTFKRPSVLGDGYDNSSLLPAPLDFKKGYCSLHTSIPCATVDACPSGESCDGLDTGFCEGQVRTAGHGLTFNCPPSSCGSGNGTCNQAATGVCVHWASTVACDAASPCPGGVPCYQGYCAIACNDSQAGPFACFEGRYGGLSAASRCIIDADCAAPDLMCFYPPEWSRGIDVAGVADGDPYMMRFVDQGVNVAHRPAPDGGCLASKAVYDVFVDGRWVTVESSFSDNFDPHAEDHLDRCLSDSRDVCATGIYAATPCPPSTHEAPQPRKPRVVGTSQGSITIEWDTPSTCEPSTPIACGGEAGPCPDQANQYCDITDLYAYAGHCRLKSPVTCGGAGGTACASGYTCTTRESEFDGYYIYATQVGLDATGAASTAHRERDVRPNAPIAVVDKAQTSYTFTNLSTTFLWQTYYYTPIVYTFRVATFDRFGRISRSSEPSDLAKPLDTGAFPSPSTKPMPSGVRTVIWTNRDLASGRPMVRIAWRPGTDDPGVIGYRVYRSPSPLAAGCVLLPGSGTNPPTCASPESLAPGQVTTPKVTFGDSSVEPGTIYYYGVSTLNGSGESEISALIPGMAFPMPVNPLSAPVSLKAESPKWHVDDAAHTEGIYLRWCANPPAERVTGYRVYRSTTTLADPGGTRVLLGTVPAICLAGRHRCELTADSRAHPFDASHVTLSTGCNYGTGGNCQIVDKEAPQPGQGSTPTPYFYAVTAVREEGGTVLESPFSAENQARHNFRDDFGDWHLVYDPDNFPDVVCGADQAMLDLDGMEIAGDRQVAEFEGMASGLAPFQVIGEIVLPVYPNAVPRFLFYHLDHLGSPRAITDSSGNLVSKHKYLPFGQEYPDESQQSLNTREFTGHERDPGSSTDYMLARYYSSSLGRFMAVDPGNDTSLLDPQSWNRYAYVGNNPVRYDDPSGRFKRGGPKSHESISETAQPAPRYVNRRDVVSGNKGADFPHRNPFISPHPDHFNANPQGAPGSTSDTRVQRGTQQLGNALHQLATDGAAGKTLGNGNHSFNDLIAHGNVSPEQHGNIDNPNSPGFQIRYDAALALEGQINQIWNTAATAILGGGDADQIIGQAQADAAAAAQAAYTDTKDKLEKAGVKPEGY